MGACFFAGLLLREGCEGLILESTNAVLVHRGTQLCAIPVHFFHYYTSYSIYSSHLEESEG